MIAADAGLGSVPLEVRVTRRWREMDSNFRGARDKGSVRRFHFAPELIATDGSPQMIDGGMLPKPPIFALSRRLHRTRNRKFESTSLQR